MPIHTQFPGGCRVDCPAAGPGCSGAIYSVVTANREWSIKGTRTIHLHIVRFSLSGIHFLACTRPPGRIPRLAAGRPRDSPDCQRGADSALVKPVHLQPLPLGRQGHTPKHGRIRSDKWWMTPKPFDPPRQPQAKGRARRQARLGGLTQPRQIPAGRRKVPLRRPWPLTTASDSGSIVWPASPGVSRPGPGPWRASSAWPITAGGVSTGPNRPARRVAAWPMWGC